MNAEPESCATCGHPRSSHFRTTTGCGVVMMPGYGCSCTEFTPAPPRPTSISDEAEAPSGWWMVSAVSETDGWTEVWDDSDDRGPRALFRDASDAEFVVAAVRAARQEEA